MELTGQDLRQAERVFRDDVRGEASVTRCTLLAFTSDFGIGWGHESRNLRGTPSVLGVLSGATNRGTILERTGERRANVRDLEIIGMWIGWDEITQDENLDKRSQGPTLRHPVFTGWVDQPSSETKKESRKAEHPEECGVASRRFPPRRGSAGLCRMLMRIETWPLKGQRGAGSGDSVEQWGQAGQFRSKGTGKGVSSYHGASMKCCTLCC